MFARSVFLTLRRRQDRAAKFIGQVLDSQEMRPGALAAIDGEICRPPVWWNRSAGAWGCYASHLRVLERSLNDGLKSVLIFEDDAVFCKDFQVRLEEFMEAVPSNWHMVYLGGTHRSTTRSEAMVPTLLNPLVYRCKQVLGTYAYAVSRAGMKELYPHLWQDSHANPKLHIDQLYATLMGPDELNLRVYAPRKWLVGHSTGVSDVTGESHTAVQWNHYHCTEPI